MKLLAFDTSAQACSVALAIGKSVYSRFELGPMKQAQLILGMIDGLLQESKTGIEELDAIAFGCGPGSFTGVRLATSVAQGIGFALTIPLIPISSLATLAQTAYEQLGWQKLGVAVDARMQELYWAQYQVNADEVVELVGKEILCKPDALPVINDQDWSGIGNGWEVYDSVIKSHPLQKETTLLPRAEAMLTLAQKKFSRHQVIDSFDAQPQYLRNKVAEKSTK